MKSQCKGEFGWNMALEKLGRSRIAILYIDRQVRVKNENGDALRKYLPTHDLIHNSLATLPLSSPRGLLDRLSIQGPQLAYSAALERQIAKQFMP